MPDTSPAPADPLAPDVSTARAVIDHAGVSVADLERSERFYQDVLGYTTVEDRFAFPQHDLQGVVLVNSQGARVELFERKGSVPTGPHHQIESTRRQGWFQFALAVPDIAGTFAAVVAAGAEPSLAPATAPDGVSLVAFVLDPDGNLVEFLQASSLRVDGRVGRGTPRSGAILKYIRPPENVLGFADLAELDVALQRWGGDERARVIVLTSGIPGYFAAHADLADVGTLVHGTMTGPHGPGAWGRALTRVSAIPQPVVAAVDGQAWGGGFELALSCLLRWRHQRPISASLKLPTVPSQGRAEPSGCPA